MRTREQIEAEIATYEKAHAYYIQQCPDDWPGPFLPLINTLRWVLEVSPPADKKNPSE